MTEDEMIQHGKQMFDKSYNGVVPVPTGVTPTNFGGFNLKLFHEVWGDERLSFRDRRVLILGILVGSGADPQLFEIHVKSALRNGELTVEELRSMMHTAVYYAGVPKAALLYLRLEQVLASVAKEAAA